MKSEEEPKFDEIIKKLDRITDLIISLQVSNDFDKRIRELDEAFKDHLNNYQTNTPTTDDGTEDAAGDMLLSDLKKETEENPERGPTMNPPKSRLPKEL